MKLLEIEEKEPSILECIGPAAMLEMLAEEATELAHAALKMARVIRNENPTPVKKKDAAKKVIEEFTDVVQCALELDLDADKVQIVKKTMRFQARWSERSVNL